MITAYRSAPYSTTLPLHMSVLNSGACNISTLHGFLLKEKEKNSTKWSSWQGLEMPVEKGKAYSKNKRMGKFVSPAHKDGYGTHSKKGR